MRKSYIVQVLLATLGFAVVAALIALSVGAPDCSSHCLARQTTAAASPAEHTAPAPALSADAANRFRSMIQTTESALPRIPDRGAALFLLSRLYGRLGELPKALALAKETVALNAGFDPGAASWLKPLQDNAEFRELVERVRLQNPPVHHARVAFTVPDKDLFPEGLAADAQKRIFYMGSMHRRKIVKITPEGEVTDFVKQGLYDLMPVGGVRVDPSNHEIWAASDPAEKQSELMHFDGNGKLLERYPAPGAGTHDLNDLVVRNSDEVFTTDTEAHLVFRFDRKSHAFTPLKFPRPIFYPNGIALSDDRNLLYVADILGVIVVDLRTNAAQEVGPGAHDTLSGIDGLYWYKGDLIGVQYGTAAFRVMRWHLAKDGHTVVSSEVIERGTDLVKDPTTGAIFEGNFYFMANTGIDNLHDDKIVDESKVEPLQIAVVALK